MGVAAGMEVTGAEAEWKSQGAQSGAAMARGGTAKADRAVAERQLSHAQMTSPLDGIVMMLKAKEGQVAQSGEPIARVFDPSDLLIRFSVPKDYRKDVKLGGRVELHIDGVERVVWATVDRISDEEAPINFAVVEADIDDSKLGPDEVRIASVGHVRLAENTPNKTSTNAVATGAVR